MYRQTSARTAKLLTMGKGFSAVEGVLEKDLGGLLMHACEEKVGHFDTKLPGNHRLTSLNRGSMSSLTR